MPEPVRRFGAAPLALAGAVCLISTSAGGAEVTSVDVARDGGTFTVEMQTRLEVPARAAFEAYTDYPRLPEINPAVQSVSVLTPADNGCLAPEHGRSTRIDVRLKVCVAFFCPRFRMTQDMRPGRDGEAFTVAAAIVPELSDYRSGNGLWRFAPCDGGSCLHFAATLEPDFWVPPLLGSWLIRRELRRQALATSEGIETVARAREEAAAAGDRRSDPAQGCEKTLDATFNKPWRLPS